MTVYKKVLRSRMLAFGISSLSCGMMLPMANVAFAGEGAGHTHSTVPKTEPEIKESAKGVKDILIEKGKIDKSWKGIDASEAVQKDFGKGKEWIVSFKNPAVADKSKEMLYLFFTLPGNYLGSNFTGK